MVITMNKHNDTQMKILQEAKKIYYDVGYTSATFQQIAKKSGTSRSLINYYYPKKQDILIDILHIYLQNIFTYLAERQTYSALMMYMLSFTIFLKSMFVSEKTIAFHVDVLQRNDRDLSPYQNYHLLFGNIANEYDLELTQEQLFYKEISIFGATSEIILSYMNGNLNIDEDTLIETTLRHTCDLLRVKNRDINDALDNLWVEYDKLDKKIFYLFNDQNEINIF